MSRHAGGRPVLTERGNGHEHQAGFARAQGFGVQPQPCHYARAEAFKDDVCAVDQAQELLPPGITLEVDCHGSLVAIEGREKPGKAARWVPTVRALDQNHIRTEVCQQHRGVGPRVLFGQAQDPNTSKWKGGHQISP